MKNIVPNGRIFYASLYIPIGIYISKNEKFKKNKISILALIILIVLNTCFNNILLEKISLVICSYIVFKIIITIDVKCEKLAKYCKHASKDFYFWHMYVYSILLLLNEKNITNTHNYIYYILTIIILFIITTFNYFIKNF